VTLSFTTHSTAWSWREQPKLRKVSGDIGGKVVVGIYEEHQGAT